jgi:uncharacterized repeat protein (TIGR03803 family)
MASTIQHQCRISGRGGRAYSAALALLIALVAGVVCLPSVQAQTFSVLYTFTGGTDGSNPYAGLIQDKSGNLYGTTYQGGSSSCGGGAGCGVVFKVDTSGHETVLYTFTGPPDGANPYGGLVMDSSGNLYGTTYVGGASAFGSVFKVDSSGHETVLYSFTGGTDGANPRAGLIRDAAGNLYGTTVGGGADGDGTVFKLDSSGNESVLHSFAGYPKDGAGPFGGLIRDAAGAFYGTTNAGGHYGPGTVFKLDKAGNETVLYSFANGADGGRPRPGVIRDTAGNLYGTTKNGGVGGPGTNCALYGCGVVFKVSKAGKETVLYSFTGTGGDGLGPWARLVQDGAGNLYGTTLSGGTNGGGTVFKLDNTGKETVLHSFVGSTDGAHPYAGLIMDSAGNLYGTTYNGGPSNGHGTVFMIAP